MSPPAPPALPRLERYTVLEHLASGGMAAVFLAQRLGSRDPCVVKRLHANLAESPVASSRFLREAEIAALLDHRYVARLLDAGREDDAFYLAMEYIPGKDFESLMLKLMREGRVIPPELSLTVAVQILEGLHYAHEFCDPGGKHLEIVHRDLSPRNVMITFDGAPKIIDFGLAHTTLGDFRTAPGMVMGTLRYMSPEQAVADPIDRRSDIYSVAAFLHEALTGRPLAMGDSAQAILRAVIAEIAPPLTDLNPRLPASLDPVLQRALAKSRDRRFQTAEELKDALLLAAGDLAHTSPARIGEFLSSQFPEDRAKAQAIMSAARSAEPPHEPTRAADPATRVIEIQGRAGEMQGAPEDGDTVLTSPVTGHVQGRRPRSHLGVLFAVLFAAALLAVGVIRRGPRTPTKPELTGSLPAKPLPAPEVAPHRGVAVDARPAPSPSEPADETVPPRVQGRRPRSEPKASEGHNDRSPASGLGTVRVAPSGVSATQGPAGEFTSPLTGQDWRGAVERALASDDVEGAARHLEAAADRLLGRDRARKVKDCIHDRILVTADEESVKFCVRKLEREIGGAP